MLCNFFHAKYAQNNIQIVLKFFNLDLRIANFEDDKHGMILMDQADNVDDLSRGESFWQYETQNFQLKGT